MPLISPRSRPVLAGILLALVVAACAGAASGPLAPVGGAVDDEASRDNSGAPSGEATGLPEGQEAAPQDDALIVRTGTLELQVSDVDATLGRARVLVAGLGGYVGASHRTTDGEHPVASITYRIPADRWDEALDGLRALGTKVVGESTESVEVTSQVVDLGARIANLQATERALQAIAGKATRISDVLEVQRELTNVRGEIERLVAQKQALEERAAFATLSVTYGIEIVAITEATKDWNPAGEVDRASAALVDILQALVVAGIWFGIVWLPVLAAFGVLALVASLALRRTGLLRRARPA